MQHVVPVERHGHEEFLTIAGEQIERLDQTDVVLTLAVAPGQLQGLLVHDPQLVLAVFGTGDGLVTVVGFLTHCPAG